MNTEYNGPRVLPCVDIAPQRGKEILMIRKAKEPLFRFIGGFADVNSSSYEIDALRETWEETGIEVVIDKYMGSTLIDDPRYRKNKDKPKTLFFLATYVSGTAMPADDVKGGEAKWMNVGDIMPYEVMPEHRPLLLMLKKALDISV